MMTAMLASGPEVYRVAHSVPTVSLTSADTFAVTPCYGKLLSVDMYYRNVTAIFMPQSQLYGHTRDILLSGMRLMPDTYDPTLRSVHQRCNPRLLMSWQHLAQWRYDTARN